jgi:hypothetical protein
MIFYTITLQFRFSKCKWASMKDIFKLPGNLCPWSVQRLSDERHNKCD